MAGRGGASGFDIHCMALAKDLKAAITPLRKKAQLIMVSSLQTKLMLIDGAKLLFPKTRAVRTINSAANRRAFEKTVRDVAVRN